ncbi:hypothetical protein H696_00602 [Fonticula alba]|uniref:Uncharacterized protein n=1 Tax=Fonticula alba TaxID=691883 RepID=A0A058ZGH0_FONAL|nr:hypothetical protein H696_00602 [Fonticula alba]KCV73056.1 hypothetical protein H696_00602 [Fonticula alba]|eukprot:XP_009492757.1 hypothetical protein H696_00602 [Fonticula alba]
MGLGSRMSNLVRRMTRRRPEQQSAEGADAGPGDTGSRRGSDHAGSGPPAADLAPGSDGGGAKAIGSPGPSFGGSPGPSSAEGALSPSGSVATMPLSPGLGATGSSGDAPGPGSSASSLSLSAERPGGGGAHGAGRTVPRTTAVTGPPSPTADADARSAGRRHSVSHLVGRKLSMRRKSTISISGSSSLSMRRQSSSHLDAAGGGGLDANFDLGDIGTPPPGALRRGASLRRMSHDHHARSVHSSFTNLPDAVPANSGQAAGSAGPSKDSASMKRRPSQALASAAAAAFAAVASAAVPGVTGGSTYSSISTPTPRASSGRGGSFSGPTGGNGGDRRASIAPPRTKGDYSQFLLDPQAAAGGSRATSTENLHLAGRRASTASSSQLSLSSGPGAAAPGGGSSTSQPCLSASSAISIQCVQPPVTAAPVGGGAPGPSSDLLALTATPPLIASPGYQPEGARPAAGPSAAQPAIVPVTVSSGPAAIAPVTDALSPPSSAMPTSPVFDSPALCASETAVSSSPSAAPLRVNTAPASSSCLPEETPIAAEPAAAPTTEQPSFVNACAISFDITDVEPAITVAPPAAAAVAAATPPPAESPPSSPSAPSATEDMSDYEARMAARRARRESTRAALQALSAC